MPVNPNILWNAVQIALAGRRTAVAVHEFRGHTYGYDMLNRVMKVPGIPYGTYHIGSTNDLGRYEMTRAILREMGLPASRVADLLEADTDKYADTPRDVRLATDRIAGHGITFDSSLDAACRALTEFGLRGTL